MGIMQFPGGPSADLYVDRCTSLLGRSAVSQCSTMVCVCWRGGGGGAQRPCDVACLSESVWTLPWTAVGLRRRSAAAPTRSPASPLRPCGPRRVSETKGDNCSSGAVVDFFKKHTTIAKLTMGGQLHECNRRLFDLSTCFQGRRTISIEQCV